MGTTVLAVKSSTYAMMAKKHLIKEGISSKLIKLDSDATENGCGYGLRLDNRDFFRAVAILGRLGIEYTALNGYD